MSELTVYDTIIVGAGAAGLTAGYEFKRFGREFIILEASNVWGGRVDGVNDLADFPLDLGGQWIHPNQEGDENRDALDSIVRDSTKSVTVQTVPDDLTYSFHEDGMWFSESKTVVDELFIGSSWHEFFNTYITPSVINDIVYNCDVGLIDYSEDDIVSLQCGDRQFQAKNVIVTASIEVLRTGGITFNPTMPGSQLTVLNKFGWVRPIKGFIKFSEEFYVPQQSFEIYTNQFPFVDGFTGLFFWDASYMEDSSAIVLGFLITGVYADVFDDLSEEEYISTVLQHLDTVYNGKAMSTYENHVIKDWRKQPYILGGWSQLYTNAFQEYLNDLQTLFAPMGDNQVYLAGEALPYDGWDSTVQSAALSGQYAACRILGGQVMNPGCTFPEVPKPTPAPTPAPTGGGFCFSGNSIVYLAGDRQVPMRELQVGDMVKVGKDKFEPVYTFGHHDDNIIASYLRIKSSGSDTQPLEITKDHLVFSVDKNGHFKSVPASTLTVGDLLLSEDESSVEILSIDQVLRKGVYAPFTLSGEIVVSGIKASNYITLQADSEKLVLGGISTPFTHQWLAHAFLAPNRILYTSRCGFKHIRPSNGIPQVIDHAHVAAKWMLEQNATLAILTVGPFMVLLLSSFWVLENLLLCNWLGFSIVIVLAFKIRAKGKSDRKL